MATTTTTKTLFGEAFREHEHPTIINEPEQIDEYGFVIMSAKARQERTYRLLKGHIASVGSSGDICKTLCKYLPHNDGRRVSYTRTKEFWCSECECVMRCPRCHCCGRVGRRETRRRNKDSVKRIE